MPNARSALLDAFLAQHRWAAAQREPLPQDASTRSYSRLSHADRTALVMDAPPETETKTAAFVRVAEALSRHQLSAPKVYAADLEHGFLLIEDFGQASFARVLSAQPDRQSSLYQSAGDVVQALNGVELSSASRYDAAELKRELEVFCDHWWPDAFGAGMPKHVRRDFYACWAEPLRLLEAAACQYPALTLRDFHVDNLFDLPGRAGPASVGLIDFQDALTGHAAYDLVSLLQDARRDVPRAVQSSVLAQVDAALNLPDFKTIYTLYGAQRALKILGVFVRLANQHQKPAYRQHLPRTWRRVMMNLGEPKLADLAAWIEAYILNADISLTAHA
ncbi:MAG: phosphotransferase [Pseudomonadota bacterium]